MTIGMAPGRRKHYGRWCGSALVACLISQAVSASGLAPFGQPFNIDVLDSGGTRYDAEATVALAADGSGVASWAVFEYATGYSYVMARRFAPNGTALGADIVVDVGPGVPNFESNPVVASDATGNFVIAWTGYAGSSPVMTRLFHADGTPATPAACIDGECRMPGPVDVSMDNAGDFAVLLGNQGAPSIHFYHPDGSAGPVQPIPVGSGTTLGSAAISMNCQNGNVDLAWLQAKMLKQNLFYGTLNSQAFLQRYNADGSIVGTPVKVFNCTETAYFTGKAYGCDTYAVSIAQDDAGNSLVAWEEHDRKGTAESVYVYARSFNSNGAGLSNKTKVSPPPLAMANVISGPVVRSAQPTIFAVAWTSEDRSTPNSPIDGSVVQEVTLNGLAYGASIQLPQFAPTIVTVPGAAANSAGDFISVWPGTASDNSQSWIQGQLFRPQ